MQSYLGDANTNQCTKDASCNFFQYCDTQNNVCAVNIKLILGIIFAVLAIIVAISFASYFAYKKLSTKKTQ
jgi:EamA domain-containing membrane protein RarD